MEELIEIIKYDHYNQQFIYQHDIGTCYQFLYYIYGWMKYLKCIRVLFRFNIILSFSLLNSNKDLFSS